MNSVSLVTPLYAEIVRRVNGRREVDDHRARARALRSDVNVARRDAARQVEDVALVGDGARRHVDDDRRASRRRR